MTRPAVELWASVVKNSSRYVDRYWYSRPTKRDMPLLRKLVIDIIVNTGAWDGADLTRKEITQVAQEIYETERELR